MTINESVYLTKMGSVATIYLNQPNKRNAMNYEMWCKLPEILEEAEQDPSIKVLLLRGAGSEAFSAGADISEFKQMRATAEQAVVYNRASKTAHQRLAGFIKPTIALIQGYCIGGGAGLALDCDFRFSDTNGRFGITPAKLGLVYGTSSTKQLVDLVGPSRAKDILMSARIMDSDEAYRIGLVDRIYEPSEIEEKTLEYANLVGVRSQYTVRAAKIIVRDILNGATENSDKVNKLVEEVFESQDYLEGVQAFMEKRKPKFTYS